MPAFFLLENIDANFCFIEVFNYYMFICCAFLAPLGIDVFKLLRSPIEEFAAANMFRIAAAD